jgi:Rap1a immunity proteins
VIQRVLIVTATLIMVVSILAAGTAQARFYDGNDLHGYCTEGAGFYDGICLGYIAAAADALSRNGLVCIPEGATLGQAREIVVRRLRDHPESRHHDAYALARTALLLAWRCP